MKHSSNRAFQRAGRHLSRGAWTTLAGARELGIGIFHAGNGLRITVCRIIAERRRRHRRA